MIREVYGDKPQEVPEIDLFIKQVLEVCQQHKFWIHYGYWEDTQEKYIAIDPFPGIHSKEVSQLKSAEVRFETYKLIKKHRGTETLICQHSGCQQKAFYKISKDVYYFDDEDYACENSEHFKSILQKALASQNQKVPVKVSVEILAENK